MACQRVGSGSPCRVGAKLRQGMARVVRQIVVDEEIISENKLPPCPFPQFRVARQVCQPFAAMAFRAVVSECDFAASEYRGIACQVRLPTPGRLAVPCRLLRVL